MEKNHPLGECILLAKNWTETIDQWTDNHFTLEFLNKKIIAKDLSTDKSEKEKLHHYLIAQIKAVLDLSFDIVINQYIQLISDKDKIDYLKGIFDTSEDLIKMFGGSNSDTNYVQFAVTYMKELNWKFHNKFDDEYFVLLNKSITIEEKAKLKFNISRAQLVHLLILLKDSNIIDNAYTDYAIATFASKFFSYLNNEQKQSPLIRMEDYIGDIRHLDQYSEIAVNEIKEKIQQSKIIFKD